MPTAFDIILGFCCIVLVAFLCAPRDRQGWLQHCRTIGSGK